MEVWDISDSLVPTCQPSPNLSGQPDLNFPLWPRPLLYSFICVSVCMSVCVIIDSIPFLHQPLTGQWSYSSKANNYRFPIEITINMSKCHLSIWHFSYWNLSTLANSQLFLTRFWPNFKGTIFNRYQQYIRQAGAELGQAQLKLGLDFNVL